MSAKQNKKSVLLGLGSLAAAGLGFYLYKSYTNNEDKTKPLQSAAQIDRQTIIKVLKELKKEMFTVFQNFAAISSNIKQQSMGRARPEEIKMMLLEQPMFRGEIDTVEDTVYSSFGINKEQMKHYCESVYREDLEIKEIQKSMKEQFDKAFQGIAPEAKTEIPAFLTPELSFEILEKVMTESALKLNEKLLELQEAGEQINVQNPKMMEVMQSLKMDSSKKQILSEYGLDKYEDPGTKILQYATQVYSQQNKNNFNAKMAELDMKYQGIMESLLMGGPMSHDELKQKMKLGKPAQSRNPFNPFAEQPNAESQQIEQAQSPVNIEQSAEQLNHQDQQEQPEQNEKQVSEPVDIPVEQQQDQQQEQQQEQEQQEQFQSAINHESQQPVEEQNE